jgi:NAD+ kinase
MRSKPEIEDKEGKKHVLQNRDLVEELIGEDFEDSVTHTPDKVYEILNDVVLDRGPNPSMYRCGLSLAIPV